MKNNFLLPLAIIVAGLLISGAILYNKNPKEENLENNQPPVEDNRNVPSQTPLGAVDIKITDKDNIRGNPDASVTIVEYSDFQCPFCARFHETMKKVMDNYSEKVRWVYRHFPLDSLHPQARSAAEASECAAEQGKFWEFADELIENQSRLGNSLYEELAGQLGLNLTQFKNCVSSKKYKDKVQQDFQSGRSNGVTGTPGSFVNGEKISGAVPYSVIESAIKKALGD